MQAEAAAAEAAAAAAEQLAELRARIAARERWLGGERAELDARCAEATAPAAAQREQCSAAAAALRAAVQELRCVHGLRGRLLRAPLTSSAF